ncbi:DNA alkylation repair protein [Synoicihabitans lomoniglobus]|uniref:DNA alkylation repair protein n=1 Tax=Synoicihabitans lomoniglobus TaxID=2909285 RepID=A0AAF0CNL8_9BACT|nr:DNA alkylation repair protein [Opitutaceae bacterium LMO-M01]WED64565.1 DNA alkylation repair protein [Opitutaceae bacterium LMO-M01]
MPTTPANVRLATALIAELRAAGDPRNVAGQQRFGIRTSDEQLGCSMPLLRGLAKAHRRNQPLALALWEQPVHEARILAALTADPSQFTPKLMDSWITGFDSWDVCDQTCMNVFRHTPHAFGRVRAWSNREPEFERRAAFALLATLGVHAKKEPDQTFLDFLPLIATAATDERNFVKKAVNWALRQIGKRRSPPLHAAALQLAEELAASPSPSARWIGRDAVRELRSRFPKP